MTNQAVKNNHSGGICMLTLGRSRTISKLAFPICVALSSTLLIALIDLAMVGRLGTSASAALGLLVFCNTIVLAFVGGVVPAVQGLVARKRGKGSTASSCLTLNAGLLLALLVGIPLTIASYW